MSNEVITHKHEWVRSLFSEHDRITKDAATMAFCRTANWVEKFSIMKAILNEYCKVAIEASFNFIPDRG